MASDILIVDDEADICELVAGLLQDEAITPAPRATATAPQRDQGATPEPRFLDIWLQGSRLDGLQLLDTVKEQHPEMPVVMISAHGNIETAVAAIKRGGLRLHRKPFKADRLVLVADRALETSRLKREVKELKALTPGANMMVGRSPRSNQLRQMIEKAAPTNSRILIVGPSGSGKELAARHLHGLSARAAGPFVVINAAAITPERMEVELFGVEQSNGSQQRKVGALEEAHGGSLFIDEIADMPRDTQNKILRVLVDQTFQRVGGSTKVAVDVRIIASTSRKHRGRDRRRPLPRGPLPPACRGADPRTAAVRAAGGHPELVTHFMEQISQSTGLPQRKIGGDAMAVLQSHDWPGNVRQLRNNVERLMILAGGDPNATINANMLPQDVGSMVPSMPNGNGGEQLMGLPLREARELFEREYLLAQINRFGATSRAPPSSLAWSAPHCTASSGAWYRLAHKQTCRSPMSRIAYVNGRYLPLAQASVNVEDRGYQFSDGVYEVCEVRQGRLIDELRHIARLQRSLSELRIAMPMSRPRSASSCAKCSAENRVRWASSICRSRAACRAATMHSRTRDPAELVVTARNLDFAHAEKLAADGVAVISVPENRWARVYIKSVSLLPNVLAKQAAREQGAREAWFVDAEGRVTEGSSSNAWIVTRDGKVVTRHADHAILRGITRTVVLDVVGRKALARRTPLHAGRGSASARGLHHFGQPDSCCRWCESMAVRSVTAPPA